MKSPFSEVDDAYKQGKKAKAKGLSLNDNPHPTPKGNRSFTAFDGWVRGWLSIPANAKLTASLPEAEPVNPPVTEPPAELNRGSDSVERMVVPPMRKATLNLRVEWSNKKWTTINSSASDQEMHNWLCTVSEEYRLRHNTERSGGTSAPVTGSQIL